MDFHLIMKIEKEVLLIFPKADRVRTTLLPDGELFVWLLISRWSVTGLVYF